MAEENGNGKHRDLPAWLYRAGLIGLVGVMIWLGQQNLAEVKRIGTKTDHHEWRLGDHEKKLDTHDRRLWTVERNQPRSLTGPN